MQVEQSLDVAAKALREWEAAYQGSSMAPALALHLIKHVARSGSACAASTKALTLPTARARASTAAAAGSAVGSANGREAASGQQRQQQQREGSREVLSRGGASRGTPSGVDPEGVGPSSAAVAGVGLTDEADLATSEEVLGVAAGHESLPEDSLVSLLHQQQEGPASPSSSLGGEGPHPAGLIPTVHVHTLEVGLKRELAWSEVGGCLR